MTTPALVVCLAILVLIVVLVAVLVKREVKATLSIWKLLSFSLDTRGTTRSPARVPSLAQLRAPDRPARPKPAPGGGGASPSR